MGIEIIVQELVEVIQKHNDPKNLNDLKEQIKNDKRFNRPTKAYLYMAIVEQKNYLSYRAGLR